MDTLKYIQDKLGGYFRGEGPVEIYRYGRDKMTLLFNELGFKKGVEVGVADGTFSEILCKNIPGLKLFGVDPWEPYAQYTDYQRRSTFNAMFDMTVSRMAPFDFTLIRKYSMDAVKDFEDGSLDFVYIDANHEYPFVVDDITEWSKKVRVGGIIAGHDFDEVRRSKLRKNWGVRKAVEEYMTKNNLKPLFVLGTNDREARDELDSARTWMYVK